MEIRLVCEARLYEFRQMIIPFLSGISSASQFGPQGRYPGECLILVMSKPQDEHKYDQILKDFIKSVCTIGAVGFDTERAVRTICIATAQ